MAPNVKAYVIGLVNAAISGAIVGGTGMALNIGTKNALIMVAASALGSAGKWFLQHPIPGGVNGSGS